MSDITREAARLMDVLPESDKVFAYEFIKKPVLAWDPDYTKVTPDEKEKIDAAEKSGYVRYDDIDRDNLGN